MLIRFFALRASRLICLPVTISLVACSGDYQEEEIKEYVLSTKSKDSAEQEAFASLVQSYNEHAGFEALLYTYNESESNSTILLTPGLNARDGKVGYGQWIRESQVDSSAVRLVGDTPKRELRYSMRLEFDRDYIMNRVADGTNESRSELMKLFAHEVGHGLQMNHHQDPLNVMYYDISGHKDFTGYFERVRQYFQ